MVNIRRLIDDVFIRDDFKQPGSTEDQPPTKIVQNFYNKAGSATGSIARDQNLTDTTIKSDRNNSPENNNYTNQSRNINISDNAQVNASGAGAFSLGDLSGEVINTINQLPNFDHEPIKKELKELLSQLPQVVLATELDEEEQAESLEQIQAIAFSLRSQDVTAKKTAKRAR